MAQSQTHLPGLRYERIMDYSNLYELVVAAILGVLGWVGRLMHKRLEDLRVGLTEVRNELHSFRFEVAQNYVPKHEMRDVIAGLKNDIKDVKDDLKDDLRIIMEMLSDKEDKR